MEELLKGQTVLFGPDETIGYKSSPAAAHITPFPSEFFVINPIRVGSMGAGIDNLSCFRNFLVEFDEISIKAQEKRIEQILDLPFSTKVFSGRRSIHYIFSMVEELTIEEYESMARLLLVTVGRKADPKMSNPNRLSRTPGEKRNGVGATQELIATGPRVSFKKFLNQCYISLTAKQKQQLVATAQTPHEMINVKWRRLPPSYKKLVENGAPLPDVSLSRHDSLVKLGVVAKKSGFLDNEIKDFLMKAAEKTGISQRNDVDSIMKWLGRRIS